MKVLGIDPGKNGALASYDGTHWKTYKMPKCPAKMAMLVSQLTLAHDLVVIERVTGWFPGAKMAFASRGFVMGCWFYGPLCSALSTAPEKVRYVMAAKWQRELGCLSGGDKKLLVDYARKLHSHVKITNQTADAILIATWSFANYEKIVRKHVYDIRESYILDLASPCNSKRKKQGRAKP